MAPNCASTLGLPVTTPTRRLYLGIGSLVPPGLLCRRLARGVPNNYVWKEIYAIINFCLNRPCDNLFIIYSFYPIIYSTKQPIYLLVLASICVNRHLLLFTRQPPQHYPFAIIVTPTLSLRLHAAVVITLTPELLFYIVRPNLRHRQQNYPSSPSTNNTVLPYHNRCLIQLVGMLDADLRLGRKRESRRCVSMNRRFLTNKRSKINLIKSRSPGRAAANGLRKQSHRHVI